MEKVTLNNAAIELRATAELAKGGAASPTAEGGGPGFPELLKGALDTVNAAQRESADLARAFELDTPGVSLHDVMIASQKANISFQAAVQVRNKLVSAYHDIMNMQV